MVGQWNDAAAAARSHLWSGLDEGLWDLHYKRPRGFQGIGTLAHRLLHNGYGTTGAEFRLAPQPGRRIHARFFATRPFLSTVGVGDRTQWTNSVDAEAAVWYQHAASTTTRLDEGPLELDASMAVSRQDELNVSVRAGDLAELGVLGGIDVKLRIGDPALTLGKSTAQVTFNIHTSAVTAALAVDPTDNYATCARVEGRLGPVRASVTTAGTPPNVAVTEVGAALSSAFNDDRGEPARYELAVVKHLHHVAFSFFYQTLFHVRLVSLGGEVLTGRPPFATAGEDVLPSIEVATQAPSSESTSTVIRIGGSWQLSRRSLVKARLGSDGSMAMLLAMRSATNPAWTLVLSGDTSVLNMANSTRLGVSVCLSQL